jgi:DNA (cytosine-5)-methyltransferase 1
MNEQPTHLDLFSGIGGFALAAGWAGFKTIGFCEIDKFCQGILKKHWPEVPIHENIKELRGGAYAGCTLLTGGFPCQPFSQAGKRRGKDDDRHLWPEMLRVIDEAKPTWVVGENVVGIIGMELDQVCSDLEAKNYEVQPIIIPACGVDAPHRRDRVWIIANNNKKRWETTGVHQRSKTFSNNIQKNRWVHPQRNFQNDGLFAEANLCGENDGIPGWVDRFGALGNAIVPQVAYQILKGIRELL